MPYSPPSFRATKIVTLVVGPDAVPFPAHLELLCGLTDFFRGATAYTFKETVDNRITMPEDDPDSVDRFLQWAYAGVYRLSNAEDSKDSKDAKNLKAKDLRYLELIRLYKLADKLQVSPLQNELLRALYMMKNEGTIPGFHDLLEANEVLPSDCSFLNLLLSHWTYHINLEWFQHPSTYEVLVSAPELCAKLTARYALRLHNSDEKSPFDQDVETHFTHPPARGGENPTSMTAGINEQTLDESQS